MPTQEVESSDSEGIFVNHLTTSDSEDQSRNSSLASVSEPKDDKLL